MWWWWWAWIAFVFFFVFLPLSVGWGRRGWGPPYPSYYRRRTYARGRTPIAPEPSDVDPTNPTVPPVRGRTAVLDRQALPATYPGERWAWLGDLLWLCVLGAIGWGIYLLVT